MFGKVFQQMFTGSMVGTGPEVFAVWTYAIVHARPPGHVELNPKVLALILGMKEDRVAEVIEFLCSPDPESRTPDHDGRKMLPESKYGYFLPNFDKYRSIRDEEERRERNRLYKQDSRARQRMSAHVSDVSKSQHKQSQISDGDADAPQSTSPPKRVVKVRHCDDPQFLAFWNAYGKKKSIGQAWKAWQKLPSNVDREAVIAAAKAASDHYVASKDGRQYQPYPATWLAAMGWEDDLSTAKPKSRFVQVGDPEEDWPV